MQTEPAPAFFLALRDGDTVTVRNMLSTAGAQSWIDYQSDLGYTPLYIAALLNHSSITEQLIVARWNIDLHREDGTTPLIIAAANDYESVTKRRSAGAGWGISALQRGQKWTCWRHEGAHSSPM